MKINVFHIAKLANLPLTDEENQKFEKQLKETLEYIENLKEVDTKNVEPTSQVTGLENVTREDLAAPSLSQEEALSNSKPASPITSQRGSIHNGFIKVKAIFDE